MNSIDRNFFIVNFLNNNPIFSDFAFLEKAKDEVIEFSLGKNYFYSLSSDSDLRLIQERIQKLFLSGVELNNSAVAFIEGLCYLDFLEPHRNGYNFLRLDVSSFFHSFNVDDIKKTFSVYFKDEVLVEGKDEKLIDIFISLVTYKVPDKSNNKYCADKTILPVGFLTSPTISNIVFRRIDIKLQEFCQQKGIIYTRYADDMLFSAPEGAGYIHSEGFEKEISIFLSLLGLRLNKRKTIKRKHTISLNGYVIQSKSNFLLANLLEPEFDKLFGIRISNKKTAIIEDMIYLYDVESKSAFEILKKLFKFDIKSKYSDAPIESKLLEKYAEDQLVNKFNGYRSYLISIVKFDACYKCVSSSALAKYIALIENIEVILGKMISPNVVKSLKPSKANS